MPSAIAKNFVLIIWPAFVLTPAVFLLVFWILALATSGLLASIGLPKMILSRGAMLSFGAAYSITQFDNEIVKQRNSE
jgi:hypothetical protein